MTASSRPCVPMPSRRRFLSVAAASAWLPRSFAAESPDPTGAPPRADDVQRPPDRVPRDLPGTMPPSLLSRGDGTSIDSWEEWLVRRDELRRTWLGFLGPWETGPVDDGIRLLDESGEGPIVRRLVAYRTEPDLEAEAWLLEPAGPAPRGGRPGAVVFHSTTDRTIDEVADPSADAPAAIGTWLAAAGFTVLCPRCHLWSHDGGWRLDTTGAGARLAARHPGAKGMRKLLHDGVRAVDVLARLDGVDPRRIVAAGHSLGAKETLYLAAFDDRLSGAVASEGGIAIPFSNWNAPWYLGAEVDGPGCPLDHAALVALSLPGGLLVLGGESGPGAADGDRSWPTIERALEVGRLGGERPWLGLLNHRGGHAIPGPARVRLVDWLVAAAARGRG